MNSISCFIIDDAPSVEFISGYVLMTSRLKLSGYAPNLSIAMNSFLLNGIPEVLFINIDTIKEFDLNLQEYMQKHQILVVATSSLKDHAFRAFESGTLDYLLKPFSYERFLKAMGRVAGIVKSKKQKNWLYIQSEVKGNILRISYEEINYIEARSNYIVISIEDKGSHNQTDEINYTAYKTLKLIEETLPPHTFIRVHKSFIVNETKIHSLNNASIILSNRKVIKIGPNYREKLIRRLLMAIHFSLLFYQFILADEWIVLMV